MQQTGFTGCSRIVSDPSDAAISFANALCSALAPLGTATIEVGAYSTAGRWADSRGAGPGRSGEHECAMSTIAPTLSSEPTRFISPLGDLCQPKRSSAAVGTVAPEAEGEGCAARDEEDNHPADELQQLEAELRVVVATQHDRRREVRQVFERQKLERLRDDLGQPVERQHLTGQKVRDHHVDEHERAD